MLVGQRLELFYSAGQEIYQAAGLNNDGTVTSWNVIVGTQESGLRQDQVHADMWDFSSMSHPQEILPGLLEMEASSTSCVPSHSTSQEAAAGRLSY